MLFEPDRKQKQVKQQVWTTNKLSQTDWTNGLKGQVLPSPYQVSIAMEKLNSKTINSNHTPINTIFNPANDSSESVGHPMIAWNDMIDFVSKREEIERRQSGKLLCSVSSILIAIFFAAFFCAA